MRIFRLCFLPVLFFLISSPSMLKAHDCGPDSITVKVGESKNWVIVNDETQLLSTYTVKSMGDTNIVRISPDQTFSGNGDGIYAFTGKKVGQTTFVIEWKATFMGTPISKGDCEVTVKVELGQQPDIDVKPTSIVFPNPIRVGASAKMTFQVFNKGNGTLNVSNISSDNTDFSAGPSSFSVAIGDSQLVEVVFEPASIGETSGVLTVVSNDPDESEVQVAVAGEGGVPDVSIVVLFAPDPVTIGNKSTGRYRLKNEGSADLLVNNITSSNPAFTVEINFPANATFPQTITSKIPNNFIDIDINFEPATVGEDSAMITIISDDPDEAELILNVKSDGLPKQPIIAVRPTSVLFLNGVRVGESAKKNFTVLNFGAGILNVTDISSNNLAFFAGPSSFTLAAGDSQVVEVVFEPIACDETLGTLTVHSNTPDQPQVLVEVGGKGLAPAIETLVPENPPPTIVGQQVKALGSVDVVNIGCDNLIISAITSSNPAFPIEIGFPGPSLPLELPFSAPNNVMTIFVDFVPLQPGADSTIITITSDDQDEPTKVVTVYSEGISPPLINLSFESIDETIRINDTQEIQIQITNPAGQNAANLDWNADLSGSPNPGDPLFIELEDPTSGSIPPGESDTLTVQLKGLMVADTTYMADIAISTNIPGGDSMLVIPVMLAVLDTNATSVENQESLPTAFSISDNYPNPFNPTTTIEYQVPVASEVKLLIYNMLGQKVRTLVDEQNQPGSYKITWDGRDDFSRTVAGGVYLVYFVAGDFKKVQKMILLK